MSRPSEKPAEFFVDRRLGKSIVEGLRAAGLSARSCTCQVFDWNALMHNDHEVFIAGIEDCKKVVLTFASKEDGGQHLVRTCAPMDYAPGRIAKDRANRYHFWDYDSDSPGGRHTLSLLPDLFPPAAFPLVERNPPPTRSAPREGYKGRVVPRYRKRPRKRGFLLRWLVREAGIRVPILSQLHCVS